MKKIITLPIDKDDDITQLKIGDVFYLSGRIITGRDEVYRRVAEEKIMPPVCLKGLASYHAGPIVHGGDDNGARELVSIGPTTSARMEKWAREFIKATSVKILIGKGGMGETAARACREHKAIHCVYPGGCAVLGASQIEKIESVYWPEFGMAECMWVLKANELGPLVVSIDANGNNLFEENKAFYKSKIKELGYDL